MRAMRGVIPVLLAAAVGTALGGCSDTVGPEAWAGVYETAIKFDGPEGVWSAHNDFVIAADSSVTLSGVIIQGAVFVGDTLSWEVAGGNSSSGSVVFRDSDDRAYYWIAKVEECFTGWIQFPGGDPLDFRGRKI